MLPAPGERGTEEEVTVKMIVDESMQGRRKIFFFFRKKEKKKLLHLKILLREIGKLQKRLRNGGNRGTEIQAI